MELTHEGIIRKSGRYPWGSGKNPYQRSKDFRAFVEELASKGMSDVEIAQAYGMTTTELRATRAIAKNAIDEQDRFTAMKLKEAGNSNVAIGKEMGRNESSVRGLLSQATEARTNKLNNTVDMLKESLGEDGYLDIGKGVENYMGISNSQLKVAVAALKDEGYETFWYQTEQLGTGKNTNTKILARPGTTFPEITANPEKIKSIATYSEDLGASFKSVSPPKPLDSKRVAVRWGEEGGADKDGVIELRRGVDDISLGNSRYAQVRISVDGTHYLKGMAMYSDDLPAGVDVLFNTNKAKNADKMKAMKPMKGDPETDDLPFGSIVRQKTYLDSKGKPQQSILNIVGSDKDGGAISGEEGAWNTWSKKLSSQMLSKQTPALAKEQLGLAYQSKKDEFDEIMALTNPVIKRRLLESFADAADSSAIHLKAAGLPRTANHVILPINSLKDDEIFAPKYNNGEKVVLIRHPHGGKFEIPELTVNNRNKEANRLIPQAADAVGINSKVAARLSGADFDGDTVLVIPNDSRKVSTSKPLKDLEGFDPQKYKNPEGVEFSGNKQRLMGDVSNLITDMTIKMASSAEIARAVKHSMVVIDSEKHNLNYKQSALDNGIKELKTKYQGKANAGASTLISQAKGRATIDAVAPRKAKDGGPIDKATGEKVFVPTGETYVRTKTSKRTGITTTETVTKKIRATKMEVAKDAHTLSSGTVMEGVYADHANRLKGLANQARKEMVNSPKLVYSPSAAKAYAPEVKSLQDKLNIALRNAPRERQAQLVAKTTVKAKQQANPDMDNDTLKKVKAQALTDARIRMGAKKELVDITDKEWNAIQAGAITDNRLSEIIKNADLEKVKALATPRERTVMTPAKMARAKQMLNNGFTQAEIASALGVPASTISSSME